MASPIEGTMASSLALPAMMASVVVTAVMNTIIRRIALVPLEHYPYFLTQVQTLTYVFFYFTILMLRRRDGTVTAEMLRIRKSPFLWIGMWDSIGDLLGNVGTSKLPGYQVPLLAKLNIVFTAIFSKFLLDKRYSKHQVASMGVVICGSVVTLLPTLTDQSQSNQSDAPFSSGLFYAAVYVASVAPTALAFVLKERIFRENEHLNLDIFVVNSFGSIFGLGFTILFLPLASVPGLGKVELSDLPSYMVDGFICFVGQDPTPEDDCTGSPLAPMLYLVINVIYNICFLTLIKHGGALLTFITNTATFPLSTILFTLSWPLLGSATLSGYILLGLCVELLGILLYHRASSKAEEVAKQQELTMAEKTLMLNEEKEEKGDDSYGSIDIARDESGDQPLRFCYNRLLRQSLECHGCNAEDLCKCLLSPKCNCG